MQTLAAWAPVVVWAGVIFFLSGRPDPDVPGWTPPGADKVAHLALYAVLGATLARAWLRTAGRRRTHWIPLLVGVLYGLSDEWHQSFVAGRHPSAGDLLADILGLACGYGAVLHVSHADGGRSGGTDRVA